MLSDPPDPLDEAMEGYFLISSGGRRPRQRGNLHADRRFRPLDEENRRQQLRHQLDSSKGQRED